MKLYATVTEGNNIWILYKGIYTYIKYNGKWKRVRAKLTGPKGRLPQ